MLIDANYTQSESELVPLLSRVSAIVFDWNGTIVDDLDRAVDATNAVLEWSGCEALDRDGFVAAFCLPLNHFFTGLGIAEDALATVTSKWNNELAARRAPLQPWIGELLEICKELGLLTGVISAAAETALEADMHACDLTHAFSFVLGSVHDKSAALRAISAPVNGTVIYIGDTEYDMAAAAGAGAIGLAYTHGYRPASALASTSAAALIADYRALIGALLGRLA